MWGNLGYNIPLLLIVLLCFSECFIVFIDFLFFGGPVHPGRTGVNRPILLSCTAVNNVQANHGVDQAHPDGGPLSPLVVHPACEQSQHGGKGNVGPGAGSTAVTLLAHNLSASALRQRHL